MGWMWRRCAAGFALLLLLSATAQAGPWSKAPGRFYAKLGQGLIWSNESGDPFFQAMTSFYGEIGIWNGLQAQLFLPFVAATRSVGTPPKDRSIFGLGDTLIGLQWTPPPLMKATGFPIAFRLDFKLPLYDKYTANTQGLDGSFTDYPLIGEGQLDITFWVSAGGSIPGTPLYAFGEVGFRFRTPLSFGEGYRELGLNFLHQLTFQSQLGYKAHKHLLIMLNLNGILPLGTGFNPASKFGELPTGLRIDGSTEFLTKGFVGLSLGLYIPVFKGLAVEATFDPLVLTFNSNFAVGFSLGVSYAY